MNIWSFILFVPVECTEWPNRAVLGIEVASLSVSAEREMAGHPLVAYLRDHLGLEIQPAWLTALGGIDTSRTGGRGTLEAQAQVVLERLLSSPLEHCSRGSLPVIPDTTEEKLIIGRFLLQINEIVDVSRPLQER